ncbi:hypothetical protein LPB136_07955 [Tenacibaculum todarodis]|uniref:Peptide zinc metalloprotease protein n=1 Tax=Tenacibaculum todarodis TaxID=1850252 RepID=A0A1L3JJH0_9FLAO|nr:hypothetical protein [Tenacibaculum todarodis]APG65286.1 hypothetical protein LPB136_07955 [Tenacibaculum todarodis]
MSLIKKTYILSSYQKDKWVIEVDNNHFIILENVKELLKILENNNTPNEALINFNLHFNDNLNEIEFEEFIHKTLTKLNLLDSKEPTKTKSFIKFEKIILNKNRAGKISSYFEFLFNPIFFWFSFFILIIIAIISVIKLPIYGNTRLPVFLIMLLYFPTILLHEIGHVAACKKFTGRSSEIGMGIYIVFPVFFSSISAIWHGKKEERIIANLAGIYMQLWCMLLFIGLYFITKSPIFIHMIFLTGVYNFIQLLPFIRSDGYWLLSDLTSTPNLLSKSKEVLKEILLPPYFLKGKIKLKKVFLFFYGAFNFIIIGNFIFFQLKYNWVGISEFPATIWNLIKNIFTLQFSKVIIQYNYVTISIFYMIVFTYLKKWVKILKDKITS